MSKYPPAQGLFLALGQKLFGHPFYGVAIGFGAMCGCLCWMLQGWMPPVFALLGTFAAIGQIGVFGYWDNSYWGGAAAAAGGALVLGALPRLALRVRLWPSVLGAVGLLVLANSRPYEGSVMAAAAAIALLWWRARRRRPVRELFSVRCALPAGLIFCAGAAWMGYYNFKLTGSPLTMAYVVNSETYGIGPNLLLSRQAKPAANRHEELRQFYEHTRDSFQQMKAQPWRRLVGFPSIFGFYCSMLCMFAMAAGAVVARGLKFWLPMAIWGVVWLSFSIETFTFPHYIAGGAGLVFVGAMYGVRRLRVFAKPFGGALALAFAGILFAQGLIVGGTDAAQGVLSASARSAVIHGLLVQGGRHLVIVRYAPTRTFSSGEWVYNAADIDNSPIVWARDMGEKDNRELLDYYCGRKVWLLEPDSSTRPRPYPGAHDAGSQETECKTGLVKIRRDISARPYIAARAIQR